MCIVSKIHLSQESMQMEENLSTLKITEKHSDEYSKTFLVWAHSSYNKLIYKIHFCFTNDYSWFNVYFGKRPFSRKSNHETCNSLNSGSHHRVWPKY